VRGLEIWLPQF